MTKWWSPRQQYTVYLVVDLVMTIEWSWLVHSRDGSLQGLNWFAWAWLLYSAFSAVQDAYFLWRLYKTGRGTAVE